MKSDNETRRALRAPEPAAPERLRIMHARVHEGPQGVRFHILDAPEYEVVRFSFVFRAGSSWQRAPFSASATANNLAEGSRMMAAQQIAEGLDFYGSYYDVTVDRDWCVASFVCLSRFFGNTVRLAREILLSPAFPEKELRTYCDKSRQNLTISRTKSDFAARELFARSIYGAGHPYGTSSPEAAYDALTREDLLDFYRRFYTAANCFVVISGDVRDDYLRSLEEMVADMPTGTVPGGRIFPEPESVHTAAALFPEAVQSSVRVGRVLFPRTHPDYTGMQVVASVLGGYFGSRLVRNLREEHGYTYGAFSAMVNFDCSGYFAATTDVGAQFTEAAVAETMKEIERLRNEPVPEEELDLVRNIMAGELMRILDGPFGIADVTIENVQNGTDNSYVERFAEEVRSITPGRVLDLARTYLAPEKLTTVITGPERPVRQ